MTLVGICAGCGWDAYMKFDDEGRFVCWYCSRCDSVKPPVMVR